MARGALDRDTPSVAVRSNRGEAIREIRYCRHPETPGLDTRITRQRFNALGHPVQSIDPRLATRQQTDPSVKANLILHPAFTGAVIASQSVDAGNVLTLNDSAGRPLLRLGATGVTRRWHYEAAPQAGRLLQVAEQLPAAPPQITERLVWAANDPAAKARNLAGQLSRHYDTAGRQQIDSLGLTGATLSATRQLLEDGDSADWQGADEAAWAGLLAPDVFTSSCTVGATGVPLTQVDAQGHAQRQRYDIAGQMAGTLLTPKGMSEQPILTSLSYSAAGQKLREAHANGVVTHFTYEPRTQRLLRLKTEHSTKATVLQDLHYAFDPVGNVLRVSNAAEARRFARNRVIEAVSTYTYDTLYQLITATGREMAGSTRHNPQRPAALPVAANDGSYANYSRRYAYDRGGNLLSTVHTSDVAEHDFTLNMTVSSHSNRAVPDTLTADPALVDGFFDAAGNQLQLQPGQTLAWTGREQLLRVTPVSRDAEGLDDQESYRYGGDGLRLVKASSREAKAASHHRRVLYLPGLEIRTRHQDDVPKETLQVVTIGQAGRAQVRMLHWDSGLPDGITNDGLRYSYDNLIGSGCLELDDKGLVISQEEYYPYGGTAVWSARSEVEADYKTLRYSGKERDATGLYYYGYRYYQPLGRWLSADPAGVVDGLNLYRMVRNNPATLGDATGLNPDDDEREHNQRSAFQIYNAVEQFSAASFDITERVDQFMKNKKLAIASSVISMVAAEVVASFATLPGTALSSIPQVAAVTSTLTSKIPAIFVAPQPPRPDTDMASRLTIKKNSWVRRVMDRVRNYASSGEFKDDLADTALNTALATQLATAQLHAPLVPVPFSGVVNIGKEVYKAIKTQKPALISEALLNVYDTKDLLRKLDATMHDLFNKWGVSIVVEGEADVGIELPASKKNSRTGRLYEGKRYISKSDYARHSRFSRQYLELAQQKFEQHFSRYYH